MNPQRYEELKAKYGAPPAPAKAVEAPVLKPSYKEDAIRWGLDEEADSSGGFMDSLKGHVQNFSQKTNEVVEDVGNAQANAGKEILSNREKSLSGEISPGEALGNDIGSVARTVGAIEGGVAKTVASAIPGGNAVLDSLGRSLDSIKSQIVNLAPDQVKKIINEHPRIKDQLGNLKDVILNIGLPERIAGGVEVPKVGEVTDAMRSSVKDIGNITKEVGTKVDTALTNIPSPKDMYLAITAKTPAEADAYITQKFQKGVRPSVGTAKKPNYDETSLRAVRDIASNKNSLKLTDSNGEINSRLPENINDFKQAVEQQKQNIFNQYDALQKTAGKKGAAVDLRPSTVALREIENNPTIQDLHPEVAKYAEKRADSLEARGEYTTQQAQDAIKNLNNTLDAFYRNPSYETASKAAVDVVIVNNLREGLDSSIEKVEGPGYQELKNKYRDLKTIEKDVIHRSVVDGRKNAKGLLDFTDILSGAEAVRALITMNPADFAASAAMKGIKEYIKYLNDPNVAIKKMFEAAEKYPNATGAGQPSVQ